jgi:capsid assembly protease
MPEHLSLNLAYPYIAARVFDTPILIAQDKLEIIVSALEPRFLNQSVEVRSMGDEDDGELMPVTEEGIAVIPVAGTLVRRGSWLNGTSGLTSYEALQARVEAAIADPRVQAILLNIDSSGGEASGVFELMEALRAVRDQKPLWAVANDQAFSAAYAIASVADRLYVPRTGGVGSVGVIALHLDHSVADEQLGLNYTVFRTGKYKAETNSYEPLTEHATESMQGRLDTVYRMFVDSVVENRPSLTPEAISNTQAQVYFGEEAIQIGFADAIGTFETALTDLSAYLTANTNEAPSTHNNGARSTMNEEQLRALLGIDPEADIVAAVEAALSEKTTQIDAITGDLNTANARIEELNDEAGQIAETLSAKEEEVVRLSERGDAFEEQNTVLRDRVEELEADHKQREGEVRIDRAKTDGRVLPCEVDADDKGTRPKLGQMAYDDPETFEALLDARPSNFTSLFAEKTSGETPDEKPAPTEELWNLINAKMDETPGLTQADARAQILKARSDLAQSVRS